MPRPVGYGRPGTKVIPDHWQKSSAAVVEGTFDCTVGIGPAGGTPAWDESAGRTQTPTAAAVYAGAAAITPVVEEDTQSTVAEDVLPMRTYLVTLRHTATAVEIGHLVTVQHAPDPMLTGRRLKVTGIEKGSRRFSRVLHAVDAN